MTARTSGRLRITKLLVLLPVLVPGSTWAKFPLAQVGRGPEPVVDGRLDDAGWKSCAQLFPFIEAEGKGPAKTQTRASVFYSDAGLHVAFRCDEPRINQLAAKYTKRDSGVWRDDCVEIFIQRPGQKGWYHVISNSLGVTYEAKDRSDKWNPALEVRAFVERDAWSVEFTVPWSDLGGPVKSGEKWRANFCRERKVEDELSSWSCTYGKFLKPERFGELVFAETAARLQAIEIPEPVPGANRARVQLKLAPGTVADVQVTGSKVVQTGAGGGEVELTYPVGLSADETLFAARIGKQVVWRVAVPTNVQPRPALATLDRSIQDLHKLQGKLSEDSSLYSSLTAAMSGAEEDAGALRGAINLSIEKGKPLKAKNYQKLNASVAASARKLSRMSWPVWTKNNWLNIGRTEFPDSCESISELNFTSLVNEYESGNVIITNLSEAPLRLRVTASDFQWLAPLSTEAENLVKNPGLNDDADRDGVPDDWRNVTGSQESHSFAAHPGRGNVLAIERPTAGKTFTVRQNLELEAGKRYTLQFWARSEGATQNVYVKVINKGWTYAAGSRPIGGTHSWRRMLFSFSMPESPGYQLVVYDAGGGTGSVWLDDFLLVEGSTDDLTFEGVAPALSVPDWQQLRGGKVVADPLIPLNRTGRLDVPPGESRQVWITLPAGDLPPGQYECSLAARPLAMTALKGPPPAKTVTVRLDVKPLRLATSPGFAVYNWDYARDEAYVRDLFEHKVNFYLINTHMASPEFDAEGNPKGGFDYSSYDRMLRIKIEYARKARGQILFAYGIIRDFQRRVTKKYGWKFRDKSWDKAFRLTYTHWLNHLKALGLRYDEYCVQVWDEATGPNIEFVVEGGKLLREIDPRVRLVMDGAQSLAEVKRIDPYIDVWIPHLNTLLHRDTEGELLKYYKQTGEPVYTYTCSTFMKALSPYSYHRLKPWYAASLGVEGVFYWAYNSWRGDPWDDFDGPIADCGVIYPAASGPISSRRWEASREGIEDWQLIRLVERLGKDSKNPSQAQKLVREAIDQVLAAPAEPERASQFRLKLMAAATKLAEASPLVITDMKHETAPVEQAFLGRKTRRSNLAVTFKTSRPATCRFLYRLKGTKRWEGLGLPANRTEHKAQVTLPPESGANWMILAWDALGRVGAVKSDQQARK